VATKAGFIQIDRATLRDVRVSEPQELGGFGLQVGRLTEEASRFAGKG
jgi:hypothetical protein